MTSHPENAPLREAYCWFTLASNKTAKVPQTNTDLADSLQCWGSFPVSFTRLDLVAVVSYCNSAMETLIVTCTVRKENVFLCTGRCFLLMFQLSGWKDYFMKLWEYARSFWNAILNHCVTFCPDTSVPHTTVNKQAKSRVNCYSE